MLRRFGSHDQTSAALLLWSELHLDVLEIQFRAWCVSGQNCSRRRREEARLTDLGTTKTWTRNSRTRVFLQLWIASHRQLGPPYRRELRRSFRLNQNL